MTEPIPDQQSAVRRIAWLHFANDFTLDFITPLLPAGVGVAWLGVMEGLADAVGQVLKLFTGRASDRTGRRAAWVAWGYSVNAIARPLSAIGMLLALPLWIVVCRVADRIGKGVRGSATDALVADWCDGGTRVRAFNHMRTMDHLGATLGGLAAALAAYLMRPEDLWLAVAGLVVVTLWVAWLARGLRDNPAAAPPVGTPAPTGWWPRDPIVKRPLIAIGIATLATKLSPLLVLVQVAGLPAEGSSERWPLWQVCLGWAALGVVQAGAAAFAGGVAARLGSRGMLILGWLTTALVFAALALLEGPWLIAAGLAFGVIAGLTEGSEKALLADLAPKHERGLTFGAMALLTAGAGLAGNAVIGAGLMWMGPHIFLFGAATPLLGMALLAARGNRPQTAN
jgi:MFS family permease